VIAVCLVAATLAFVIASAWIASSFSRMAVASERVAAAADKLSKVSEQNFAGAMTGVAEALEEAGKAMTGLMVAAQSYQDYDRHRGA
jgi:hypothetical protein